MTLREIIESNSRKPMIELMKERAHLKFNEDEYGHAYCEEYCPHRYEDYYWECPGGCRTWDDGMTEGHQTVYGADMLIGDVLRNGYESLGVESINEPFKDWSNTNYVYWEDVDGRICEGCEYYGKTECPEDILSAECPRSGDAWAVERIAYAVNEVLECNL